MASEIYHIVFTVYTAVNCNTAKNKTNITNIVIITFLYCNWKQKSNKRQSETGFNENKVLQQ